MLFKLLEDSKSNENKQKPTHFAVFLTQLEKLLEMKFIVIIKLIDQKHQMI